MPALVLLCISVCCCVLGECVKNRLAKSAIQTRSDTAAFQLIACCTTAVFLAILGGAVRISGYTMMLAVLFGFLVGVLQIASTEMYRFGPMSLGTLISLCGMLIPTLAGTVLWHESVSLLRAVGIVLMIAAMVCILNPKSGGNITVVWVILACCAFCFDGSIGLTQQFLNRSAYAGENRGFLFYSFLVASAVIAVYLLVLRTTGKREKVTFSLIGIPGAAAVLFGLTYAGQHILNLYLVSVLPSAVFFPLCNCSCILLLAAVDALVFREKLTKRQKLGFFIGLLAAILVSGTIDDLFF